MEKRTYQNIVRLDVSVKDIAFAEEGKTEEHLSGIGTNGFETNADIADSGFLENFSKIKTTWD